MNTNFILITTKIVPSMSAIELSRGITKLSGSQPRLYVAIPMMNEMSEIMVKPVMLTMMHRSVNVIRLVLIPVARHIVKPATPYSMWINSDANCILMISLDNPLMDESLGVIVPNANLVVVIEPIIEPIAPRAFNKTGYITRISGRVAMLYLKLAKIIPPKTPSKLVKNTVGVASLKVEV